MNNEAAHGRLIATHSESGASEGLQVRMGLGTRENVNVSLPSTAQRVGETDQGSYDRCKRSVSTPQGGWSRTPLTYGGP
jgi:hypothetical protein